MNYDRISINNNCDSLRDYIPGITDNRVSISERYGRFQER